MKKISVTILAGFLGAGKTTILNKVLQQSNIEQTAVIVNDFGAINIDATYLQTWQQKTKNYTMVELQNGCICCELQDDLITSMQTLITEQPQITTIIIEASGVSEPQNVAYGIMQQAEFTVDSIITAVDAAEFFTTYLQNEELAELLLEQIEHANIICVTKTDLITVGDKQKLIEFITELNPTSRIDEVLNGDISVQQLLNQQLFDVDAQSALYNSNHHHHHHHDTQFLSFVFTTRKPLNRELFYQYVEQFPVEIIRSKGIIWFSDEKEMMNYWSQAGKGCSVLPLGEWVVTMSPAEQAAIRETDSYLQKIWDAEVGDCLTELVIIGQNLVEAEIRAQLEACIEK